MFVIKGFFGKGGGEGFFTCSGVGFVVGVVFEGVVLEFGFFGFGKELLHFALAEIRVVAFDFGLGGHAGAGVQCD